MTGRLGATIAPEEAGSVLDRIVADSRRERTAAVQDTRSTSAATSVAVVYLSQHRNHLVVWD